MKIKSIELKNFKRFTDLRIDNIPESAKLVLLIGSNGSGKSSVFDLFELQNPIETIPNNNKRDLSYYEKDKTKSNHDWSIEFYNSETIQTLRKIPKNSFYGRTSYRQIPKLERKQLGNFNSESSNIKTDADRPKFFIDRDLRFENDIERICVKILREVFQNKSNFEEIIKNFIDPINKALSNIFNSETNTIQLTEIIPPLDGNVTQLNFKKGISTIHYDFLSAGEKEVVNILFNLLARKDNFQDTVYFLDEIDLHLNTKIQYNLLKEITENWIPENCQLWTASHSLGFIEYAKQSEEAVILDFDDLNFDEPQVISPQSKENLDLYEIAVPKEILSSIFKDKKLIFCEGEDYKSYNLLNLDDTFFLGLKGGSSEVFIRIKSDNQYFGLRDRDLLSNNEIELLEGKFTNFKILRYYNIENYLYHPDNVNEINLEGFNKEKYISQIVEQKNSAKGLILAKMESSRNHYKDLKELQLPKKELDKNLTEIVTAFESDKFEDFYKYFDMKADFKNSPYKPYELNLAQTKWFKTQIEKCLNIKN